MQVSPIAEWRRRGDLEQHQEEWVLVQEESTWPSTEILLWSRQLFHYCSLPFFSGIYLSLTSWRIVMESLKRKIKRVMSYNRKLLLQFGKLIFHDDHWSFVKKNYLKQNCRIPPIELWMEIKYVNTVWRSSFRNLYDISVPVLWLPATLPS